MKHQNLRNPSLFIYLFIYLFILKAPKKAVTLIKDGTVIETCQLIWQQLTIPQNEKFSKFFSQENAIFCAKKINSILWWWKKNICMSVTMTTSMSLHGKEKNSICTDCARLEIKFQEQEKSHYFINIYILINEFYFRAVWTNNSEKVRNYWIFSIVRLWKIRQYEFYERLFFSKTLVSI